MNVSGSRTLRPRQRRTRRYLFLCLLLLALAAPAGFVVAGETRSPYIVVFSEGAVSRPAAYSTSESGSTTAFRTLAMPESMRQSLARAQAGGGGGGATEVDDQRVVSHVREIVARMRVSVSSVYTSVIGGFAAQLTPSQARTMAGDPTVAAVVPDVAIELDQGPAGKEAGSVRTTANPDTRVPPGIKRVGARSTYVMSFTARDQRVDADVAIIDTGVERDHPDLNVVGGYNCTGRNRDKWDDVNGHGTHVAGIVGALDNRIGVVGVAPGVRLWSVKVLDSQGKGFLSWMVCGVDWVTAQRDRNNSRPLIEVANMSISFGLPGSNDRDCGRAAGDPLHEAICRSVKQGTTYVAAAGNESNNARRYRPGAYDEVITVSAMADYDGRGGGRSRPSDSCPYWSPEPDDSFASFSNYGPDVDLIAPGKCILSTYRGKRYAWMSGTSMATPHVSGAAAIYRSMFPRATPQQVRLGLIGIGTSDWNTGTDPDKTHERAVWIGSFRQTPDFMLGTISPDTAAPGGRLAISVNLDRVGGFRDPVTVGLDRAPSGFSAVPVTTRAKSAALSVEVGSRVRTGRYALTISATSGGEERNARVVVQVTDGGVVSPRDRTPPRAPSVTLDGRRISINLDGLGVSEAHIGRGGTLWVRGGISGWLSLRVGSRDPESGIAGNRAVTAGKGWRAVWNGDSTEGDLRLGYSRRGVDGELYVTSVNGAGLKSAATVGHLKRDYSAPRAVEWVSAPSGTTIHTRAPNFRLDWTGGSDAQSGLAAQHLIRRYKAPLKRDGSCVRLGFSPDGVFRLAFDRSLETDLERNACYVWSVRTLDNVGNFPASIVSGYVITR
ncbi:hypothetical protein BH24CHL5_BH24CHL5_10890 [soil metagenome]